VQLTPLGRTGEGAKAEALAAAAARHARTIFLPAGTGQRNRRHRAPACARLNARLACLRPHLVMLLDQCRLRRRGRLECSHIVWSLKAHTEVCIP